jgi:DNA repair protein RadD
VYDYTLPQAIEDGYLCRIFSKQTNTTINTDGVRTIGGEFNMKDLEAASDKNEITNAILDEIFSRLNWRGGHWINFCTGIQHADHMRDGFRARGIHAESINYLTPKDERDRLLNWAKTAEDSVLCSADILTTGYNDRHAWLEINTKPTKSSGLLVQMVGRISRPVYAPGMPLDTAEQRKAAIAAGPKPFAMLLDFAGNLERHGPIDLIHPKQHIERDANGKVPMKSCPECSTELAISVTVCPDCGYKFPAPKITLTETASQAPVLSIDQAPIWEEVNDVGYKLHQKSPGRAPCLEVRYRCEFLDYKEWVHFEGHPYAQALAEKWWWRAGGERPVPNNTITAVQRAGAELRRPSHIRVERDGKYWKVVAQRYVSPMQSKER